MLHTYSIMPLNEREFDKICNDVKDQFERKISSVPLFRMTLVPEGNPVWNKVEKECELYSRFRKALEPCGIKTGVLIQACIGHGYPLVRPPFQYMVNFNDGKEVDCMCPEDENFINHFKDVVRRIASEHPDTIMLDDDVRALVRPGRGCACPLHMKKFKEVYGCDMTREELYNHVMTHKKDDPVTLNFIEMQKDSLVNFVRELRSAIDSVDPTIQGVNCTSGDECDSVIYTAKEFSGKGNPTIVRVPNGTYAPDTVYGFSDTMRRAVVSGSKLKNNGIDIVIAECDTVPFNRYAKNARYLHAHYTASILDGLKGAKHWLTRFSVNEKNSGKAFRDILAEHIGFYEKLAELSGDISWVGANSMFLEQKHHDFTKETCWVYHDNNWAKCVFERLGIPFYYAEKNTCVAFLEGDIISDMSDSEIESVFEGSVFMDGTSAAELVKRGYGDKIGVSLHDASGVSVKGESFDGTDQWFCAVQRNFKIIKTEDENVKAVSHNYTRRRDEVEIVSPAVTVYPRENGKISVVYCGEPYCGTLGCDFNYAQGYSFLNESRKKQLVDLLMKAGALPVYYPGDNEVLLRAGYLPNGTLLAAVFVLGYDPMENIELYLENKPTEIRRILSDGSFEKIGFTQNENGNCIVEAKAEPLYPVILLIK